MTNEEVHLKCLELALVQARNEGKHGEIDRVAEIETRFYNHITGEIAETRPNRKPKKADKSPEIFK